MEWHEGKIMDGYRIWVGIMVMPRYSHMHANHITSGTKPSLASVFMGVDHMPLLFVLTAPSPKLS